MTKPGAKLGLILRDAAHREKGRHSWDKKGDWGGSKDVRTCLKCGVTARKETRLFSGWVVDEVQYYYMPECQGDVVRCGSCQHWRRDIRDLDDRCECPILDQLGAVVLSPTSVPRNFFTPEGFGCVHHEKRPRPSP